MENNLDFSSPIIMGILNVTPDSFQMVEPILQQNLLLIGL